MHKYRCNCTHKYRYKYETKATALCRNSSCDEETVICFAGRGLGCSAKEGICLLLNWPTVHCSSAQLRLLTTQLLIGEVLIFTGNAMQFNAVWHLLDRILGSSACAMSCLVAVLLVTSNNDKAMCVMCHKSVKVWCWVSIAFEMCFIEEEINQGIGWASQVKWGSRWKGD